jgi:hypothetical protein
VRLFTHTIFTWGVASLFFYWIGIHFDNQLLTSFVYIWLIYFLAVSWLGNHVIDIFGHAILPNGMPKRLARTHSVFTAPIWGAGCAVVVTWLLSKVWIFHVTPYYAGAIMIGVFVGYSHLFLDAFTQAGIYFTTKRIDIMHLSYNNTIANLLAILAGFGSFYVLAHLVG